MRMAMWSPDTGTLARDRWGFSAGWSGRVMMNVRGVGESSFGEPL